MKHSLIFHLHIPKTAGTSLNEALVNVYPRNMTADDVHLWQHPPRWGEYDFVYGHWDWRAVATMPEDTLIVCVLRSPVLRLVSLYNYWRSLPETLPESRTEAVVEAKRLTLEQWAESPETDVAKSNQMTHLLAGGVVDLDAAIRNLDRCMVGFQWEYWRFLGRLSKRIGQNLPQYWRLISPARHAATDRAIRALVERNGADLALYEYAMARHELGGCG